MKLHRALLLATGLALAVAAPAGAQQADSARPGASGPARARLAATLQAAQARQAAAQDAARKEGARLRGVSNGKEYMIVGSAPDGRAEYCATDNFNAAISTGANLIRDTAPYNLNGGGWLIGLWDGGAARATHVEFGGRVIVYTPDAISNHATHVAGTLAASGINSSATGMAPLAQVASRSFSGLEFFEMFSEGASFGGEAGKLYLSNHSYGTLSGWDFGDYSGNGNAYHWFGPFGQREDTSFGQYDGTAQAWDTICYTLPYYLPFKSAGNDRNNNAPPDGTTYYYRNVGWVSGVYSSATGPFNDGYDSGYDTIPTYGCAKNIMTVGAANDASANNVRSLPSGTISSFSGWGPTDDGRIKPDVVANGVNLFSSEGDNDTDYATYNGTSMSTPNTCGSATLLLQLYGNLFPGQWMRSSTLKGLIIHTADDVGNAGPDYTYGWGWVNAKAAADQIIARSNYPSVFKIAEETLDGATPSRSHTFLWDGASPIRATICWTDPDHAWQAGLDNSTIVLVNDLDLRVFGPGGTPTYSPFILNPAARANPATTGDNIRDNVEQVLIAAPGTPGLYTVQISHKGTLTNASQVYSLFLSGQSGDNDLQISPPTDFNASGPQGTGPFAPGCASYTLTNFSASPLNWTSSGPAWITVTPPSGTLGAGGSVGVNVCVNSGANSLPCGFNTDVLNITNTTGAKTQKINLKLTATGCAAIPFYDGFETGPTLQPYWTSTGTSQFRTQSTNGPVAPANPAQPHIGQYHVAFDDTTSDATFSRNELTLCVNLSGQSGVYLSYWSKKYGSEATHAPPAGAFVGGANFDGVALSADGVNWRALQGLAALTTTYSKYLIDLDAAVASFGMTYNSMFRIRFNHYDDDPITTDGIAIDDVQIAVGIPPTLTPTPTLTPSPSFTPSLTPTATPTPTATATPTISETPTPSATPTASLTPSQTASLTPSQTASLTPSQTASLTPSQTASLTPSFTPSPSVSPTLTLSPSLTLTPTTPPTLSITPSLTPSPTASPTPSASATPTASPTPNAAEDWEVYG